MSDDSPVIIDAANGDIETLPPAKNHRYRAKLDTVQDVRRELAKLYRETRSGLIDPADATKLGWLLGEVRKTIELETKLIEQPAMDSNRPMTLSEFYDSQDDLKNAVAEAARTVIDKF